MTTVQEHWKQVRRLCRALFVILGSGAACGIGAAHAEQITVTVDAQTSAGRMSTWFEPGAFATYAHGPYVASNLDAVGDFIRDSGGSTRGMFRLGVADHIKNSQGLSQFRERLRRSDMADLCRRIEASGAQLTIELNGTPPWAVPRARGKGSAASRAPRDDAWNEWENVVYETVHYFNGELGLKNTWYEFWNEPDFVYQWNDSPEKFLRMWQVFYQGAKRADSKARVGGCPVSFFRAPFGFEKGGTPILKRFLEFSRRNNLQVDFVSPHFFQPRPEEARMGVQLVQSWLNENGYPGALIIVDEYNPRDKMLRLPWPSPPTALGRVSDAEMAAPYVLSVMQNMEASGSKGYLSYGLISPDQTSDFGNKYRDGAWGSRTHGKLNAIRKAVYHGLTIAGRMKRSLVASTVNDPEAEHEAFPHFHVLSGAEGGTLTILMWNFVSNPTMLTALKLREVLGPERMRTLLPQEPDERGFRALKALLDGATPAARQLDAETQRALSQARQNYQRQGQLVTEEHDVSLKIDNFPSSSGYQLTRYLIDATHSNAYYYFVKMGLEAAKQRQMLETVDSRHIRSLSEIGKVHLAPYSVTLLVLEAGGGGAGVQVGRERPGTEAAH